MTTTPRGNEPESLWPRNIAPIVGHTFRPGSNETVTIETVTDDYVYLSNGKRVRRP